MTKKEYELIQTRLSNKLKKGYSNKEEGYNNGILSAKSIIKELFETQVNKEVLGNG